MASPKQILELRTEQEKMNKKKQMPKAISDTRWAARASAVENVRDNFECYVGALENLITSDELNAISLADAEGLTKSIMNQTRFKVQCLMLAFYVSWFRAVCSSFLL